MQLVINNEIKRLAIDSITSIFVPMIKDRARSLFQNALIRPLKKLGVSMLYVAELPIGEEKIGYGFEEFLNDFVFIMTFEERKGVIRRYLKVHKSRDISLPRVNYEFIIGKGGIRLHSPLETSLRGSYVNEKTTIGIPELDKTLNGGVYKASTILVTGDSGVGKTMLALKFAIGGISNGDKVLFISFEESKEQLIMNLRLLGIDNYPFNDSLIFVSINPHANTPSSIYLHIKELIMSYGAERLIMDGCSVLEANFTISEYVELIKSLILLAKSNKVTMLITESKNLLRSDKSKISDLCDVIINLWFEIDKSNVITKLAILKARGIKYDKRVHYIGQNFEMR